MRKTELGNAEQSLSTRRKDSRICCGPVLGRDTKRSDYDING